jgi:putative transposase
MKPIADDLITELLKDYQKPEDLLGENGLFKQLKKAVLERALAGELTHHLGYEKSDRQSAEQKSRGNARNGTKPKTLTTDDGDLTIEVPRDRQATFQPQLIKKGQSRFEGFDDKIISLYARGLTQREITGHLKEIYGVEVSAEFISTVTDSVLDEVRTWQSRPLDALYPILYLDALIIKTKQDGRIINKAFYLAIGVKTTGHKEVLGLWASENEGAKFWLSIVTDLANRGVKDIFIACVDGLKGLPEAVESVFPKTMIQLCIVHLLRNSLNYVSAKDKKAVATDLKLIYRAPTADAAEQALSDFEQKWKAKYPMIAKSWRSNWTRVVGMFGFSEPIRRIIYTTNAIESLNFSLRKIIKNRSLFPNDESVFKLLYLALKNVEKKWTVPIQNWGQIMNQFAILFEDRMPIN